MNFIRKHRNLSVIAPIAILVVCLSLIAVAKANDEAQEASLNTPKSVNVQAQLETDGSMSVVDQRTFSLDSQKRIVNWEISKTTKMSETVVTGVRLIYSSEAEAEVVPLEEGELTNNVKRALDGGDANNANLSDAWFFNSEDSWFYASISPKTLETDVVIEVSYVIHNAFYVYDDVAEVYWDYLPHAKLSPVQQLATSKNANISIAASVLVPSTQGSEVVDKKNIWGWGHGFDGCIEFIELGGYSYVSNASVLNKDSRSHIIFPAKWLTNYDKSSLTNVGGARKNNAISEEAKWTDANSIQQSNSAILSALTTSISFIILFISTIRYAFTTRKYKLMLRNNTSLESQLDFDTHSLKTQKTLLCTGIICLLCSILALISAHDVASFIAFASSFVVCFVESNWTPTIHSTFRDRIIR